LQTGYTRLPVYRESMEKIVGIAHARDALALLSGERKGGLATILRDTFFVPEAMTLEELLYQFQQKRTHMAMVVDEYGGVEGIVTLEDVLEEIVGEIRDEHDMEGEAVRFLPGGEALVQGSTSIRDVNQALKLDLPTDTDVTLGGFVTTQLSHLPDAGESFLYGECRFLVERTGRHRVLVVRVTPVNMPPQEEP
jgi:CBS domain containing-hemolysin-like protein